MKKNNLGVLIAVVVIICVAFLAYRQLDMAVTIEQQQSQIGFYKRQQEEVMKVMNRLLIGASLSEVKRVSDEVLLNEFTKEEGTTIIIGSLKYEFKDDRCVKVSIEE